MEKKHAAKAGNDSEHGGRHPSDEVAARSADSDQSTPQEADHEEKVDAPKGYWHTYPCSHVERIEAGQKEEEACSVCEG